MSAIEKRIRKCNVDFAECGFAVGELVSPFRALVCNTFAAMTRECDVDVNENRFPNLLLVQRNRSAERAIGRGKSDKKDGGVSKGART